MAASIRRPARRLLAAKALVLLLACRARAVGAEVQPTVLSLGQSGAVQEMVASGSLVFFTARLNFEVLGGGASYVLRLWKSDGTVAGTVPIVQVSSSHEIRRLTAVSGVLFYADVDLFTLGGELWRSDGTAAGTRKIADAGEPEAVVDGNLVYRADREDFWIDATGTTRPVVDSRKGGFGAPVAVDHELYFLRKAGTTVALWKNGLGAVPSRLKVFRHSTAWSPVVPFRHLGYVVIAKGRGLRLWRVGKKGTARVAPSYRNYPGGPCSGLPPGLADGGGRLVLGLHDKLGRVVLWGIDPGTGAREELMRVVPFFESQFRFCYEVGIDYLYTGNRDPLFGASGVSLLAGTTGHFFFTVRERELWSSDGTRRGTRMLGEFAKIGPRADVGDLSVIAVVDGTSPALLLTDGSPGGTRRLATLPREVDKMAAVGDRVFASFDSYAVVVVTVPRP